MAELLLDRLDARALADHQRGGRMPKVVQRQLLRQGIGSAVRVQLFRFDDEMFVTPHLYGRIGYRAPLLHLRRLGAGGVFDTFAGGFEGLWATTTPLKSAA